jgi:hypothetical protein
MMNWLESALVTLSLITNRDSSSDVDICWSLAIFCSLERV